MNILGLDIASNTGWCILKDGQLFKHGVIHIPPEMNLVQRLSFFEMNLKNILDENDIDYCCLEDVILGISGAKTLAYLSRLNGIALLSCFNKVKNNIRLYVPGQWKSNSFEGLNGQSQKVDIQISVCKYYKLIEDSELDKIVSPLTKIKDNSDDAREKVKQLKMQIQKDSSFLKRKRNGPASEEEKKSYINKIKTMKLECDNIETSIKKLKNDISKLYNSVSISITSVCGLTNDVSDAIGIAMCGYKEFIQNGV